MSVKQKVAEILAARDGLPVDCVIDQLNLMIEEMRDAAEYADWWANDLAVEDVWTDWTGLEPDYFAEFILENL